MVVRLSVMDWWLVQGVFCLLPIGCWVGTFPPWPGWIKLCTCTHIFSYCFWPHIVGMFICICLIFVMFFVCCMCEPVFCTFQAPLFDVPSHSWKSNLRAQHPQCCSHLCPLMIQQRLSIPSHGYHCQDTHTHTILHTWSDILSDLLLWWVLSSNQSGCLCWSGSDVLFLQWWMDGCQAGVKAVLFSHHFSGLFW